MDPTYCSTLKPNPTHPNPSPGCTPTTPVIVHLSCPAPVVVPCVPGEPGECCGVQPIQPECNPLEPAQAVTTTQQPTAEPLKPVSQQQQQQYDEEMLCTGLENNRRRKQNNTNNNSVECENMVDSGVDSEPSPSSPDSDIRSTSSPVPRSTPTNTHNNNLPKQPTSNLPKQSIGLKPTDLLRKPTKPTLNNLPMVLDVCRTSHSPGGNLNTSNDFLEDSTKMETVEALLSLSDTSRSPDNSPEKSIITILPAPNPDKECAVCGRCGHPLIALEPHTCKSTPPPTPQTTVQTIAAMTPSSASGGFNSSQSQTVQSLPNVSTAGISLTATSTTAFTNLQTAITAAVAANQQTSSAAGQDSMLHLCSICNKDFANVYRLQRHMISHDESSLLRRFKCTDCGKAFKFKHHLKEHVRIHTGDKPFECNHCGKRFSHSGSYSSHMTSKKCQGVPGAKDDLSSASSFSNGMVDSPYSQHHSSVDEIVKRIVDSPPLSFSKPMSVIPDSIREDAESPPLSTAYLPSFSRSPAQSPPTISIASPPTLILSPTTFALNSLLTPEAASSLPGASSIPGLAPAGNIPVLPHGLVKPDLLRKPLPTEALLANLSALRGIGGGIANGLGSQEVSNLRLLLETVNLAVTRSLLEDNLMRWGAAAAAAANVQAVQQQQQRQQQHQYIPEKLTGARHYSYDSDCTSEDEGGSPAPYLLEPDIEMREEKKSRVRSLISEEQLNILRSCYNINPMPKKEELMQIADAIGHPYKVVKVWFQNSRARDRREGKSVSTQHHLGQSMPSIYLNKYPTPPPSIGSLLQSPGSTPSPQPPHQPSTMPIAFPISSLPGTVLHQRSPLSIVTSSTPLDLSSSGSTGSVSTAYCRQQLSPSVTPPPLVVAEPDDHRLIIKEEEDSDEDDSGDEEEKELEEVERQQQLMRRNSFEAMIREKLVSLTPDQGVLRRSVGSETASLGSSTNASGKENNDGGGVGGGSGVEEVGGVYQCDLCDKTFNKKSSITRHKYEHSDLRPHKCGECDKAFKHKHHLTEHRRLHSGEKPFQCPKCFKRFSHSGSYSQHINHRFSYCKPATSAVVTNSSSEAVSPLSSANPSFTPKTELAIENTLESLLANGRIKLEPQSSLAKGLNMNSTPLPEGVIKVEQPISSAAMTFTNSLAAGSAVRQAIHNAVLKTSFPNDITNTTMSSSGSQAKPVFSNMAAVTTNNSNQSSKPVLTSGSAMPQNIIVKHPMTA